MENKKVVPVWVSVIMLLLCAVSIVATIVMFTDASSNKFSKIIPCVFCLCAVVLAVIYCFMGYKKSAAKFFTAFSVMLALLVLLQANHYMTSVSTQQSVPQNAAVEELATPPAEDRLALEDERPALGDERPAPAKENSEYSIFINSIGISDKITLSVLMFGMLFTLTVAKDLGKKKSYRLAGLVVAFSLISAVIALKRALASLNNAAFTFGAFNAGICIEFSIFILCVIYCIMIYAKYKDKEARGTK